MGVVSSSTKIITGAASNTLGTIGNSLFNSTLGAVLDKKSTDEIYNTIDKLQSEIETADKTIDTEALNGRNNADDLFVLLASLDIKSSSDFMNKNREFLKRLMRLNAQEKDITLNALGVDATGESNVIRNEYVKNYDYVGENNYTENYVKNLARNQQSGDETTILQLESSTNFDYAGNHNDLYVVNQNLYPDDTNKGTFPNKWLVENRESLLYKTKKLFNSKKINTIISRFHTEPSRQPSLLDNAKSKYGLSHGRNLLTKDAETGYNSSYANGYDNPYCRVWTHHHQYDRFFKTIRPFSSVDGQGNFSGSLSLEDFHKWRHFSDEEDVPANYDGSGGTLGQWGWKKEANNGWQYSVLNSENGRVNITPKYVKGGSSNIHTKQCMFSIENLAWKGYDPYSFEKALSWEQRGPLGGRIMWFPPYGIQFNETTTTQWTSNTFLGRGEDVYTYSNTTRTGTLSFMMVVDHPSIIDYVNWNKENKNVSDTDMLRFLAGCGENGDSGIRNAAEPTPLTDEYVQQHMSTFAQQDLSKELVEKQISGESTEVTPMEEKIENKSFCFYVFFPNNYSGVYDDNESEVSQKYKINTKVDPIPYLIAGKGAQKTYKSPKDDKNFEQDIPLNDENGNEWNGNGYEMNLGTDDKGSNKGLCSDVKDSDKNYIMGCGFNNNRNSNPPQFWVGLDDKRKNDYVAVNNKKWTNRIDGRYIYPEDSNEEKCHYYNQNPSSNKDNVSYGLNLNVASVAKYNSNLKLDENDNTKYIDSCTNSEAFTLAEVAYVLYDGNEAKQNKCNIENPSSNVRLTRLKELLDKEHIKEITSINAVGYASAHGYVELNKELAVNRGKTVAHWFLKNAGIVGQNDKINATFETVNETNVGSLKEGDKQNGSQVSGDETKAISKADRYARIYVSYTTSTMVPVISANGTSSEADDRLPPEKIVTTGFYFETTNPIEHSRITPKPLGSYNSEFTFEKIEMTKNNDDNYVLVFDGGGTIYNVYNFREESYQKSNEKIYVDNEGHFEFVKTRSFSFEYNNHHCIINEYTRTEESNNNYGIICFAQDDIENYYYLKEPNFAEDISISFVDPKPIHYETMENYVKNLDNSDVTISKILFDSNQQILSIVNDKEKKNDVRIVNIIKNGIKDEEIKPPLKPSVNKQWEYEITLVDGGKINISYEYEYTNENAENDRFIYRQVCVINPTNLTQLIGKNNYFVTTVKNPNFEISGSTVLSIQKNSVEWIKLIEKDKNNQLSKDALIMRFKEPTDDKSAPFNESYENVNFEVESFIIDDATSEERIYWINTKNNGVFYVYVNLSKNKVNIQRLKDSTDHKYDVMATYSNTKILEKYPYPKEDPDICVAPKKQSLCKIDRCLWIYGNDLYMFLDPYDVAYNENLQKFTIKTHSIDKKEGKYNIILSDNKTVVITSNTTNDGVLISFGNEEAKEYKDFTLYKPNCDEIDLSMKETETYFYIGLTNEGQFCLGKLTNTTFYIRLNYLYQLKYENEMIEYKLKQIPDKKDNIYTLETDNGTITITDNFEKGFIIKFQNLPYVPFEYRNVLVVDGRTTDIKDVSLKVETSGFQSPLIKLKDKKIGMYLNNESEISQYGAWLETDAESLIIKENKYFINSFGSNYCLELNPFYYDDMCQYVLDIVNEKKHIEGIIENASFYYDAPQTNKSRAIAKANATENQGGSETATNGIILQASNGDKRLDIKCTSGGFLTFGDFGITYEEITRTNVIDNGLGIVIKIQDNKSITLIPMQIGNDQDDKKEEQLKIIDYNNNEFLMPNYTLTYQEYTIKNVKEFLDVYQKLPYFKPTIKKDDVEDTTPTEKVDELTTTTTGGETSDDKESAKRYVGYNPTGETGFYNGKEYPIFMDDKGKKWYMVTDPDSKIAKFISVDYAAEEDVTPLQRNDGINGDKNRLRYDQEYHFFKVLKQEDPVVFNSLMDKLKYFDPAFHSMTPEGFNGRLTFLQQCMRQGNTVSASDGKFAKNANNLAFGRAPYCVLRLGDFYNQIIIIESLSINYDPLVWDLNVEGVGVQPLLATVQLSFKFVGGGDLTGPVRRLQNAMSFNYYANTRLYDNRADRVERMWSEKTCGAIQNEEILTTSDDYYDAAFNIEDVDEKLKVLDMALKQSKREEKFGKDKNGSIKSSSFYTTKMYK